MDKMTDSRAAEVLERLRGVLQHAKMGNSYLISQDLIHKAIDAITAPPSAPVGVDGLVREYRQSMDVEVLHAWAQDVVRALTQQPEPKPEARGARIARRRDVRLWMRHNAGFYDTATELAEAADDVFRLPDGGLDNETHWVWDEAVDAINDAQREEQS